MRLTGRLCGAALLLTLAVPGAAQVRENVDITLTQVYNPWWPEYIWYKTRITNNEPTPVTCNVWTMIQMPSGSWVGPTLGPIRVFLSAAATTGRLRSQVLPGTAPAGTYNLYGYVGDYPAIKWDSSGFSFNWPPWPGDGESGAGNESNSGGYSGDHPAAEWDRYCFDITKTWQEDGEAEANDWMNTGESFDEHETAFALSGFTLHSAYPNPFNLATTIRYQLPELSFVNLSVYDISRQKVVELVNGWREEGMNEVTFDGSDLASGIYIYQLQVG